MKVDRINYQHLCRDNKNNSKIIGHVLNEAIDVFKKVKREDHGYDFCYNEDHPLQLKDLREIGYYFEKIWNDEEIYSVTEE